VYSPLSEAPDPYPLLEASIDSLVTADETLPKLVEENERLQKSLANVTEQLEESERRLEQERSARAELEGARDDKIKDVEISWSAVIKEKQDNWEAKERNLEEKIENQDRLLKELKASYEVSQRLGRGEDENAGQSGATAAELEIVSSELDRANMRLAEVEARNEQLRLELAQSASNTHKADAVAVEDDPTFQRLQSENASLVRRLETARYDKDSEKRKWEAETRALERDVTALRADRDSLREKVHKWSDYDSIKSELDVLKVRQSVFRHIDQFSNSG
jgi:homeobox protein cut-like